jgi:hypothetical protein
MPADFREALDIIERLNKPQEPQAGNVVGIYALVGFGCLAIIIAIVLERM